MRSLGSVGVRIFRRAFGKLALTATGVMLGVAVLFAVQVANTSASRSFERQFLALARQSVTLSTPDQQVPAEAVPTAASLPGVHTVSAYVRFEARLADRERDGEPWTISISGNAFAQGPAYDPTTELAEAYTTEGRPVADGTLEVSIGDGLARELGVDVGDAITVDAPAGRRDLEVARIFTRKDGETSDFGLGTSVATARALSKHDAFTGVYVELADDVDVNDWISLNRGAFPATVLVSETGPDIERFREFTRAMNAGFATAALLAVFVGSFLIFLTLSMQVSERTAMYGMFRALGATRGQIARVVFAEAAALAVVATALGLALGLLVAVGLTRLVADLYGIESARLAVTPGSVIFAVATGVSVTLLGAAVPARRAARLEPVAAMRREAAEVTSRRRLALLGVVAIVVGVVAGIIRPPGRNDPTLLVIMGGAILVLPLVIRPVTRVVGAATRRLSRGVGAIGVLHLQKEANRSAYTMGLVMVVLATVLTLTSVKLTFERALDRVLDRTLDADVFAYAATGFDDETLQQLRDVEGSAGLTPFRALPTRVTIDGVPERADVVVLDTDSYFDQLGFLWADGSDGAAIAGLTRAEPPGVVVNEREARRLGVEVGDALALETPGGAVDFAVAGIASTLAADKIRVFVAGDVADDHWGPGPAQWLLAVAEPGTSPEQLELAMERELDGRTDVTVRLGSQERSDARRFNDSIFSIFSVVVLVALVVGLLGLANTLAIAVFRRTREIGVLRAVGSERRHVAAMIMVESLTLAGAAALLAVPLGAGMAALVVKAVSADLGITLDFAFAWSTVPLVAVTAALLGTIAALLPGRRAARVAPVAALRFD